MGGYGWYNPRANHQPRGVLWSFGHCSFCSWKQKNGGNSPFSLPPQAPDCLLILLESTLMIFTWYGAVQSHRDATNHPSHGWPFYIVLKPMVTWLRTPMKPESFSTGLLWYRHRRTKSRHVEARSPSQSAHHKQGNAARKDAGSF